MLRITQGNRGGKGFGIGPIPTLIPNPQVPNSEDGPILVACQALAGAFEAAAPPHDWWDWYAAYMDARERGISPDESEAAADRYMAEVKGVVAHR